jgi:hypothetical protein
LAAVQFENQVADIGALKIPGLRAERVDLLNGDDRMRLAAQDIDVLISMRR